MQNEQGNMQEVKTCFNFQPSKQNAFKVLGIVRKLSFQQILKGNREGRKLRDRKEARELACGGKDRN